MVYLLVHDSGENYNVERLQTLEDYNERTGVSSTIAHFTVSMEMPFNFRFFTSAHNTQQHKMRAHTHTQAQAQEYTHIGTGTGTGTRIHTHTHRQNVSCICMCIYENRVKQPIQEPVCNTQTDAHITLRETTSIPCCPPHCGHCAQERYTHTNTGRETYGHMYIQTHMETV